MPKPAANFAPILRKRKREAPDVIVIDGECDMVEEDNVVELTVNGPSFLADYVEWCP